MILVQTLNFTSNSIKDLDEIVGSGITDVFVLMKSYEFRKYKVPSLIQVSFQIFLVAGVVLCPFTTINFVN